MDLHRFDLNLLVTLDALLTEKNVTRAGLRMNLSQSAMSGGLARLREFFQDELLVPMGRQMVLTPLAQDLAQPVRDVLLQVQATIVTKPRFEAATSTRHFSIAVSDYVTSVLMVEFLRELQCQSPSITCELRPVGRRATEDLESGELDFLIAPELYASVVHPKEMLFEDTHMCVAWNKNRAIGTTISVEQYLALGHVIVHVGELGSANYDERMLRAVNCRRNIEVVTASFDLAPQLVIGTERIATVPRQAGSQVCRTPANQAAASPCRYSADRRSVAVAPGARSRSSAPVASQPAQGRRGSARRCGRGLGVIRSSTFGQPPTTLTRNSARRRYGFVTVRTCISLAASCFSRKFAQKLSPTTSGRR